MRNWLPARPGSSLLDRNKLQPSLRKTHGISADLASPRYAWPSDQHREHRDTKGSELFALGVASAGPRTIRRYSRVATASAYIRQLAIPCYEPKKKVADVPAAVCAVALVARVSVQHPHAPCGCRTPDGAATVRLIGDRVTWCASHSRILQALPATAQGLPGHALNTR